MYLTSQTLISSGIKTGRIKVDDQVEKKTRFSKKKTGFYSRKTLDANKLGGKSIKVCKRTNLPTRKHGGDFA